MNALDNTVSILLGNGDGTFQPQTIYSVSENPQTIVVGDFNNDKKLDLAVAGANTGSITILLGNGDGTFTQATSSPTISGYVVTMVSGDFNGDKKLDLAVLGWNGNSNPGTLSVFLGKGDGTFEAPKSTTVGNAFGILVPGDFNGDQKLDLVAGVSKSYGPLYLLAGNGDGTFQSQEIVGSEQIPYGTDQIAAADFNGDGNKDLAILSTVNSAVGDLTILLGNGDGTFQYSPALVQSIKGPFFASGAAVGKFNGDSSFDLAVANRDGNAVLLFTGIGDGTFQPPLSYPISSEPTGLAAAIFNGSGNPIAFASAIEGGNDNTVSVVIPGSQVSSFSSEQQFIMPPGTFASHSFQCSYSGDANYGPSVSDPFTGSYSQAAPPQFSLLVGAYPAAQPVQITDASAGATIYYTTDGSDPTTNSTVYTGPITISSTTKLKAIAGGGYLSSEISEAVYTIASAPEFSAVAAKSVGLDESITAAATTAQKITITDKTPGAIIYYTTDGTAPSTNSTKYTAPFTLLKSSTVRAFAAAHGYIDSNLSAQVFAIDLPKPEITWATPVAITYGTPLGTKQLDATSPVKGTFTYSPSKGTILAAGTYWITATFTPSNPDLYAPVTKKIEITVKHATLTLAASNASAVVGASIPPLTYTITGFVNGDNRTDLFIS